DAGLVVAADRAVLRHALHQHADAAAVDRERAPDLSSGGDSADADRRRQGGGGASASYAPPAALLAGRRPAAGAASVYRDSQLLSLCPRLPTAGCDHPE